MGNMGTTLSPNAINQVPFERVPNAQGESLMYQEESNPVTSQSESSKELSQQDTKGASDFKELQQSDLYSYPSTELTDSPTKGRVNALAAKCSAEQGFCTTFNGCDTVSHIYKGYCATDYSEVCCVARLTVCEASEGLCTEDASACDAAAAIMSQKYEIEFFTWMSCDANRVCCRPRKRSKKFDAFIAAYKSSEAEVEDAPPRQMVRTSVSTRKPQKKPTGVYMTVKDIEKAENMQTGKSLTLVNDRKQSNQPRKISRTQKLAKSRKVPRTRRIKQNKRSGKRVPSGRQARYQQNSQKQQYGIQQQPEDLLKSMSSGPFTNVPPDSTPRLSSSIMASLLKPLLATSNYIENNLDPLQYDHMDNMDPYGFRDSPRFESRTDGQVNPNEALVSNTLNEENYNKYLSLFQQMYN